MTLTQSATGQWKKLYDFGYNVEVVYFKEFTPIPEVGFAGVSGATGESKLWRTDDGGITWRVLNQPPNHLGERIRPTCFTFKDSNEGWFCSLYGSAVCRTTDGGVTWNFIVPDSPYSLYYHSYSDLLFGTVNNWSYIYSLDGITFDEIDLPGNFSSISVTFSDDLHGIMTEPGGFNGNIIYTDDGGFTWKPSVLHSQTYQPVGIKGTKTFFASQEFSGTTTANGVYRSDDGGISWTKTYQHPVTTDFHVTGTMQVGTGMRLFMQTYPDGSEGILVSEDSGKTFFSLCGPQNFPETRFYVRDTFIYAAQKYGGLWLNTTGIGSNSKPILSHTQITMQPINCSETDTLLRFTIFDSCNGRQALLMNASLSGSPRFSISSGGDSRRIVTNDSLRIKFDPQAINVTNDTALLHLRFKLGWKEFDTIVTFIGNSANTKDSISFLATLTKPSVTWEETTELRVLPNKASSDKGLAEIRFDITVDADVLEPLTNYSTGIAGATIQMNPSTPVGKLTRYPFVITGNNMTLDPAVSVINLPMRPYVSDTTMTTIELSTIHLNPQDPDYERCTLSATGNGVPFQLNLMCGDSLLSQYLGGKPILVLTSLTPNPANGVITIDFNSSITGQVTLQIINDIGDVSVEEKLVVTQNRNTHEVSLLSLPSGTFFIRLQIGKDVVTGKFVKQ